MNLFGRETAAIQTDGIDAEERQRFTTGDDIRRNIFADFRTALNHHVCTDVRELMNKRTATNDCEIINLHFAGKLSHIGHNNIIAQHTIVRNVTIRHNEVVVAKYGLTAAGCTAMDSSELTNDTVVSDNRPSLLAFIFQVLRYCTNDG